MAMEHKIWRNTGLERAAEVCDDMARLALEAAADLGKSTDPEKWLERLKLEGDARCYREAASKIREEQAG